MSLSQDLNKMFVDIRKAKVLSAQISLTMFMSNPTDEDIAAFALLLKVVNGITVPDLQFMVDDEGTMHDLITNGEDDDFPRA
jgi:hypothetical protein